VGADGLVVLVEGGAKRLLNVSFGVFVARPVADVVALYGDLVDHRASARSACAQIDVLATRLLEGHRRRHAGAAVELHNWLPGATQQAPTALFGLPLTLDDARDAAARAHGFADRHAAALAVAGGDTELEAAIEALLQGDVVGLTAAIDRTPDLVVRRSHYGHGATLLHYLAANGVETYRQRVPLNGAAIASMLLARGADPNAEADMYSGRRRTRGMLISSAHPRLAGVTDEILRVLDRAGAA
jgi:hypothetical protein